MKDGDTITFKHAGIEIVGKVTELLPEGRARIAGTDGYKYIVKTADTKKELSKEKDKLEKTKNKPNKTKSMTEKTTSPKEETTPAPAVASPELEAQKKKILALTCKKHQRIWLIYSLGLEKAEVLSLAKCNAGELHNARKRYAEKPELVEKAKALLNG